MTETTPDLTTPPPGNAKSAVLKPGLSQVRTDAVVAEMLRIETAIDALVAVCAACADDTLSAVTVRWFCDALRGHAYTALRFLDSCESEPTPNLQFNKIQGTQAYP